MGPFSELTESMLDVLRPDQQCAGVRFVSAYPDETVENPVNRSVVSVGIDSLTISQPSIGETVGHSQAGYQTGRRADWTVSFHIYVPRSMGGRGCHDTFSAIVGALLERQTSWKVGAVHCGKVTYHRDTRTFGLECTALLTTLLRLQR